MRIQKGEPYNVFKALVYQSEASYKFCPFDKLTLQKLFCKTKEMTPMSLSLASPLLLLLIINYLVQMNIEYNPAGLDMIALN